MTHTTRTLLAIYRLSDDLGETLGGPFYEPKLPKVTAPVVTLYHVESMLQHCKVEGRRQRLVEWFGSRPSSTAGLMPRPSSAIKTSRASVVLSFDLSVVDDKKRRRRRRQRNPSSTVSTRHSLST